MGRLTGKKAVVTGASSGIGRATALLFAAEGAHVLAADVSDALDTLSSEKPAIQTMRCDAGDEESVPALIARALDLFGDLDIVHANAGILGGTAGLFDMSAADWEATLRVNLIGPFLAIKYGAQAMHERGHGGSIICTASVAGLRSGAGGAAYSASKAGIINLVQVAAQQMTGSGIRVNAICPGLIESGMTAMIYDRAREKGTEASIGKLNPMRRGGEPEEIAAAALFLASDESSYVNGHALVVDGGLSSSHPFNRQMFGKTAL